ncbi:hypothetical protein HMPREF9318_01257 [Streptococcus urinalis FB127-CNA-2]|uniref:Uncharacterized protein n=1 Tax=Streptococcus urinalis 2285-97 TaxID=764291 RepID=G5KCA6_9STRE|nr:hypothetical protein [Streptococcus urinalis]EHJ57773.1 hypothetical protein STRUR_0420 [Streptococcus urinalis 2285-97]EKS19735.1 hypothetical protein HMPREF9318_01257 [Streptococcus urinalis FB127-CNA-2]VEF31312.1 Uncharacterised protein [Streptococcus urinalis]
MLKTDHKTTILEPAVLSKIENICSVFELKQLLEIEFQKNNNYFKSIIFDDFLKLTEPNEALLNRYSLSLGKQIDTHLSVLLISDLLSHDDIISFEKLFLKFTKQLDKSPLNTNDLHLFSRNQQVVLVFGRHSTLTKHLQKLQTFVSSFIGHDHYYIGISTEKPYWKLRQALDESKQAIRFAKSNQKSNHLQYYQEIGILKLLTDDQGSINHLFVDELYEQFLLPVIQYDAANKTQLYKTLSVFFLIIIFLTPQVVKHSSFT